MKKRTILRCLSTVVIALVQSAGFAAPRTFVPDVTFTGSSLSGWDQLGDASWKAEWKEFKSAIHDNREPIGSGKDGLRANEVIEAIYRSHQNMNVVHLS